MSGAHNLCLSDVNFESLIFKSFHPFLKSSFQLINLHSNNDQIIGIEEFPWTADS